MGQYQLLMKSLNSRPVLWRFFCISMAVMLLFPLVETTAQEISVPVFNSLKRDSKGYEDSLKAACRRVEAELLTRPADARHDSLRIRLYNTVSELYIHSDRSRLDTVFVYAEKLYQVSKKYGDKQMMLRALFRMELKYRRLHQYSESLKLCFEAMDICEQLGDQCKRIGEIEQILGNTFLYARDYANAEKYIQRALEHIDLYAYRSKERLMVDKGYLTGTLAKIYTRWKKTDQAEQQYIAQLKLMKASGLALAVANASEELGDFYTQHGKPESAAPYYDEALSRYLEKKHQEGIASVYNGKAEAFLALRSYDEALSYAGKALEIAEREKLDLLKPFTYDVIYKANLALDRELEALRANRKAAALKDSNDLKARLLALNDVRKLYELEQARLTNEKQRMVEEFRISSLEKQYELSKLKAEKLTQDFRLNEISRRLENEKAVSNENYLKLVAEKHRHEEERLARQLKVKELSNKLSYDALQRKTLWGIIALVSVTGAVGVSYSFILRRKNQQLKAKNAEVQEALIKGQTLERKRVATELHDNLGSLLSAVRVSLLTLDSNKLPTHDQSVYQQISQMVDDACKEVRLISHNMLPEELEKFGLEEALNKMVMRLNFSTPIEFTLNCKVVRTLELEKKTSFHLYSICLELINNILKHSGASDATLTFRSEGDYLDLFVRDNGVGLDHSEKGKGMESIADRVALMGGRHEIYSETGEGTRVHVRVPVSQSVHSALQI